MRRGMTLVETMVALVIFGVISAAVVAVFRGHVRLTHPLQARATMVHDARAAYDILSRELRGATSIIEGAADSITFTSRISGSNQTYKYVIRSRSLRREAGGGGLQEVVENAVRLRFQYRNTEGNLITPPINTANDQTVKRIDVTVAVMLPDGRDTMTVSGTVQPRNLY